VPQGLFMQYFIYILQSVSTGRFYVGQTYDLDKRFAQHNSELAGHTLKEQPWKIVWHITVETRREAMAIERKIKSRGAQRYLQDIRFGM